jgi:hypothetical protein
MLCSCLHATHKYWIYLLLIISVRPSYSYKHFIYHCRDLIKNCLLILSSSHRHKAREPLLLFNFIKHAVHDAWILNSFTTFILQSMISKTNPTRVIKNCKNWQNSVPLSEVVIVHCPHNLHFNHNGLTSKAKIETKKCRKHLAKVGD